jgi:hypothetical protein
MSGELWDRQEGEPLLWFRRYERFRLMEPARSINAVFDEEHPTENDGKSRQKVPGEWYKQAKKWRWEERAAAWDAFLDDCLEKQIFAERKKVLRSRYALQHKRIETLDHIAQKLIDYLEDEKNIWLPDVKAVAGLPVNVIRFNAPLLDKIRDYLADIAAEKGERVKKNDMTITFPPDVYEGIGPDDDGSEP